ncbi:MAG: PrsW family glutamic-type intramembrane protease [Candidatus Saccharimonadales bacterium]
MFIFLAGLMAWYLISHDRGAKEPVSGLWIAVGFGVLAAAVAGVAESIIIPGHYLSHPSSGTPLQLLAVAMAIGVVEESFKFIPLALYLYHKSFFNEHTDGIIYFALAGLGFGLPENILYAFSFGAKSGLMRVIMTPIFHSTTTALVGYFLIRAKLGHRKPIALVSTALLAAIFLHGLYDFGLLVAGQIPLFALLSVILTGALTICFFWLYKKATQQDQALGISSQGANDFCRHCGTANPEHNLYCSHCGKHA